MNESDTIEDIRVIRWIPVTERMPTWETYTDSNGNVMHGCARVLTRSDDNCFEMNIAHFSQGEWIKTGWGRPAEGITHWAELPSPPGDAMNLDDLPFNISAIFERLDGMDLPPEARTLIDQIPTYIEILIANARKP